MTPEEQSRAVEVAREAARAAGHHATADYSRRSDAVEISAHDIKLKLDIECQELITRHLSQAFPDIGVFGEEGITAGRDPDSRWVVDPIDGTVNFSRGLPIWGHSIALEHRGEICAGVFYMPEMDWMFSAGGEHPARLNEKPIHPSNCRRLADAITLTGLPKQSEGATPPYQLYETLAQNCLKTRVMGAAAADICMVACGRADAYLESCIHYWDIAAAGYIAKQAGAQCAVLEKYGGDKLRYVAAAPNLYGKACEIMRACYQAGRH